MESDHPTTPKDYEASLLQRLEATESQYQNTAPLLTLPKDIEFEQDGDDETRKRSSMTALSAADTHTSDGLFYSPVTSASPVPPVPGATDDASAQSPGPVLDNLKDDNSSLTPTLTRKSLGSESSDRISRASLSSVLTPNSLGSDSGNRRTSLSQSHRSLKKSIKKIEKVILSTPAFPDDTDASVEEKLTNAMQHNKTLLEQRKVILVLLATTEQRFSAYEKESTRRRAKSKADFDSSLKDNELLTAALEKNNEALDAATHELSMLQDLYTQDHLQNEFAKRRIEQLELELKTKRDEIDAVLAEAKTRDRRDAEAAAKKREGDAELRAPLLPSTNEVVDSDPDDEMCQQQNWFLRCCCVAKKGKSKSSDSLSTMPTAGTS